MEIEEHCLINEHSANDAKVIKCIDRRLNYLIEAEIEGRRRIEEKIEAEAKAMDAVNKRIIDLIIDVVLEGLPEVFIERGLLCRCPVESSESKSVPRTPQLQPRRDLSMDQNPSAGERREVSLKLAANVGCVIEPIYCTLTAEEVVLFVERQDTKPRYRMLVSMRALDLVVGEEIGVETGSLERERVLGMIVGIGSIMMLRCRWVISVEPSSLSFAVLGVEFGLFSLIGAIFQNLGSWR
jgi:hypothetical protein